MRVRFQADWVVRGLKRTFPEIDIQTSVEAGLAGLPDPEVLRIAAAQGRILISQDRGTMPEHFGRFVIGSASPGVMLLRKQGYGRFRHRRDRPDLERKRGRRMGQPLGLDSALIAIYCEITIWDSAVSVMVVMWMNGMLESYGYCTITSTGQPGELTPLDDVQPDPVAGHVVVTVIRLGAMPGRLRL
jgi:hypothetical protein